jgi:hypothetical protein
MHTGLDTSWLKRFERENGRPLRVLHIGNIAANGYLNAKFQRSIGIDADVLNIDYRHVMAFPEWEDADLKHHHVDDFDPKFHPEDRANFQRPDWFIYGNIYQATEEVRARYQKIGPLARALAPLRIFLQRVRGRLGRELQRFHALVRRAIAPFERSRPALRTVRAVWRRDGPEAEISRLQGLFRGYFPDRADQLQVNDVRYYVNLQRVYRALLEPYDVVQAYATMGYIPLVANTKPYTTFEHGTLRAFTMEDQPLHRVTALSYRHSQHSFITNGDCLAFAKALKLDSFSPMIHPINVDQHRQDFAQDVAQIRAELAADILIFCPARHDYAIKGTDRAIQALKLVTQRSDKRVVMVMAAWGNDVEQSRQMVRDLGLSAQVHWQPSMCRLRMIRYLQAADVVLDQFVLPVFGSTAPQAIAAGRPIISAYRPEETAWLIPEPAPIESAFTAEEIADKILQCVDPVWLRDYQERAKRWCDLYHAPDTALRDHLSVYKRILGYTGPDPA